MVENNDPYWLPEDREKVTAWSLDRSRRCPKCSTHEDEWKDDANAYVAIVHRCPGCERIGVAQEIRQSDSGSMHGLYMRLIPPDDV